MNKKYYYSFYYHIVEKWRNNQQETQIIYYIKNMEKNYNCGSSETIRKALNFNFNDFYKYGHAHHVPRIEESFLEWFIGFFEGDGSLGFSKKRCYNRSRNGKNYIEPVCERLFFTICQKERQIIEKISYTFGFGSVSSFKKNEIIYWRWSLDSKESIERISYLLSGNLILTKRQEQFLKWVEMGEKKNMFKFPFNKNKPWTSNISLKNGWISGFIDAEGCFYANFSIPSTLKHKIKKLPIMKKNWSKQDYEMFLEISKYKFKLKQKITLTQVSTYENLELFKKILILFEGKTLYIFNNNKMSKVTYNSYVRIEFNSLSSHKLIINYLTNYPLQTIKNVSFKRWQRVYLRRKEGIHLSPKGTRRLYRLVNAINNHSKKLYDKKYIY
uniref:hypothetical protein n=1 Tax=Ulva tepida TaxID=1451047 RepID=UPI00220F44F3|nr:hypothetical protein ON870_pgp023 [Ulva tepida]UXW92153.1 hypothetical protein [Ulva tepida]